MDYLLVKHVHMTCAALSGGFFLVRGVWMLADSALLQQRWVKTLPHLIDTLLLLSAITLAVLSAQYPLTHGWLTAKILALLAYIVLGSIALKRGRSKASRTVAFAAALLSFGYIVSVAISKDPLPFL